MNSIGILKVQQLTSKLAALLFALAALRVLWVAIVTPIGWSALGVSFLLAFAVLGVGLLIGRPWALRTAGVVLLLTAVILPLSVFSIFGAANYWAVGQEPPPVAASLAWLIPTEIFLLVAAYILHYQQQAAPARPAC